MTLPRNAALAAIALIMPTLAWADFTVSNEPSELTSTLGTLSTNTSTNAQANNANILQNNVDSLNAQIRSYQSSLSGMSSSNSSYAVLKSKIAQLSATSTAMQGIIARLNEGYVISSYATATDASDQNTAVTITFSKPGSSSGIVLTANIPPVTDSSGDAISTSDSSNSSDGSDMLTQILQSAAAQLLASGGQNPLSGIQNTLNSLISGNASALTPQALTNSLTTALTNATGIGNMPLCAAGSNQVAGDGVAVYDIAAGKVYMPDGSVLEAHSGMGAMMDNPNYVNQIMSGPTPPNTYNLSMRESLYHGVEALRLTPENTDAMYNRTGILAHTKLVRGANNGSHGCVAFADYDKFLAAFKAGQVKKLVVVPNKADAKNLCEPPKYQSPNATI